jgi:hypothetical protein
MLGCAVMNTILDEIAKENIRGRRHENKGLRLAVVT